jgi:ubiquinone/menaquinone biosynthesis C-methylase UbiE
MNQSPTGSAPRDFYDSEYHFEQDLDRPDEARIHHAMRHLEPLSGFDAIDLGCGAGWATRMLSSAGAKRVAGLDFSHKALALARKHSPGIPWIEADGTNLPIADNSFDRLFCNGALEHFPDVKKGISELFRILRTGAIAVMIVPNFYVRTEQPMEFRTHYWGWKKLFTAAGFTLIRTGVDWGPPIRGSRSLKRSIVRSVGKMLGAVPFMPYQFIFVLRKA